MVRDAVFHHAEGDDARRIWTVSDDPSRTGWENDADQDDYGVRRDKAELMAAAPQLVAALLTAHFYAMTGQPYEDDHQQLVGALLERLGYDVRREGDIPVADAADRLRSDAELAVRAAQLKAEEWEG